VSKVYIRKMVECDLAEVSELTLLANPHAVKDEYKRYLEDLLKNQPDLSFVAVVVTVSLVMCRLRFVVLWLLFKT
jgi:hypothetical protein